MLKFLSKHSKIRKFITGCKVFIKVMKLVYSCIHQGELKIRFLFLQETEMYDCNLYLVQSAKDCDEYVSDCEVQQEIVGYRFETCKICSKTIFK